MILEVMIVNKKIIASVLAVASVLTVSAGALADDFADACIPQWECA